MTQLWQSIDGSIRSLSAMTDEHLANVLLHLTHYNYSYCDKVFEEVLQEACTIRKLSDKFLHDAPYPYKDVRTGKWMIWSFKKRCIVDVNTLVEY